MLTADNRALIHARVRATLPSAIPGQNDYRFDTQTAEQVAGTFFACRRQPSRWISCIGCGSGSTMRCRPQMYPPMWIEHPVSSDVELPIQLRPANQLAVVSGRIVNPLGEGVGGMTVQVFDETTRSFRRRR